MKHTRSTITLMGSLALLSLSTIFTPALHAEENSAQMLAKKDRMKHETTGVLGGALIGGLLAGPPGAIVSAAFGGWLSDLTLAKKENGQLSEALTQQEQDLIALQAQYRSLEARYQVASREAQTRVNSRVVRNAGATPFGLSTDQLAITSGITECCQDSELVLHFKTNSVAIEPLYLEKLTEFVALSNTIPKAVVEITGHADRRGNANNNLALSQKRVQTVEEKLKFLGLRNKPLQTNAFGENKPQSRVDSFEDNFFDRRVVLKIISADKSMLTRTNN